MLVLLRVYFKTIGKNELEPEYARCPPYELYQNNNNRNRWISFVNINICEKIYMYINKII